MRNLLLLILRLFLIALFVVSLGIEMVSAAGFPSVKELYGRYKFSGECSYVDMVSGAAGEAPVPATTGYNMAVLPGESENELKVLGFFGYGGGVTLTYNQEDGTLKGETPTAVFMMGMNLMVVADAASTGGTVVFNYQVTEKDGKIEITAQNALENVTIMDMEDGIMGMLSYASAYTMTKEDISYNLSDVIGEYDFASTRVDNNLLADASENFKLKITGNTSETVPSGVSVGNWFGVENTEVAAEFYADGGILVLPHDVKLANGMCFGAQPEEEGGYNPNEASFFFVEKDKLVTPGYLVLDNGFDEVMEMPLQMAVIGGEAVKTGSGISSRCIKDVKIYSSDGSIRVEGLESAEISVFDAQGMLVSSVHGATAAFGGLKSGLYLVKVGSQTAKVVVK